jgi:hypothetical protein
MKYRLLILPLLCLFCACAKKKDRNKVPSIMLKGISTNEIKTGSSGFVHVFFSFADGDGDLGVKPSSGDFDIYTIDNRDTAKVGYFFPFELPDLRQDNEPLTGDCALSLEGAYMLLRPTRPGGDTVNYEIYIRDQAGNESNHINTGDIYILP